MNIVVVGAGIIGVSTAYRIKEKHPSANVTVIAKTFSPNTTSDGSAGFWEPFYPGDTPEDLVARWSKETYDFVGDLMKNEPSSGKLGLMRTHGYNLFKSNRVEIPYWVDIVDDFHVLKGKELERFPSYIKSGFGFTTFFIESNRLIPWLSDKFTELGGQFIQKEVHSFEEFDSKYDIIVNCSGLGARELVPDKAVHPVRGQITKVRAPWVREFIMWNDEIDRAVYILPNQDFVVLGGTKYVNDSNANVELCDKEWIINSTKEFLPSLACAEEMGDWVGFRPARNSMRVEKEDMKGSSGKVKIVHNYGHGGSGITVHWGCAGDAVKLVTQCIDELMLLTSRL